MITIDTSIDMTTRDTSIDSLAVGISNNIPAIDYQGFPHVIHQIIRAAPLDVSKAFRIVCRETKFIADQRLLRSVILTDPGRRGERFDLHAPAGEFEAGEPSRRIPINPLCLTLFEMTPFKKYYQQVSALEPLIRHTRVVETRMQTGDLRSCAFITAIERITDWGHNLDAYREQSALKRKTNRTFILSDLKVHFVSLALHGVSPCVNLGSHSSNASTVVVVNVDFYDTRAWEDGHASEIRAKSWRLAKGLTYPPTSLTFVFHPFNAATAVHLTTPPSPYLSDPHELPLGILRGPISIAAYFLPDVKLTLVGMENLKPSHVYRAWQLGIDASTPKGRREMAAMVGEELAHSRKEGAMHSQPIQVECLTMSEFRDRIGEEQYELQVVPPPPPVKRAP